MKILICLSYYYPNISGLTLYAKTLAEELVARGNKVTIITSHHAKALPCEELINGVKVIRLSTVGIIKKVPIMPLLPFQIIPYIQWADVVNCHLPQLESVIISGFTRVFKKPFVATYQTDLTIRSAHYLHALPLYLSDSIVALSEDYAKYSKVLPHFSKKLTYIFPPIYSPRPTNASIRAIKNRINSDGKYVIGFVGRLSAEKGIEYLFDAIRYLDTAFVKKIIIAIAGPRPIGEEKYQRKIKKLLEKQSKHIIVLGQLAKDQLDGFYKNLDVLVLPSVNATEALGIVQIEAMLCGVPVIASNLPGVRVPIEITKMGRIVEPRDSRGLAKAMEEVIHNKKKYIKNAMYIKDIFSLKRSVTAYEHIFKFVTST